MRIPEGARVALAAPVRAWPDLMPAWEGMVIAFIVRIPWPQTAIRRTASAEAIASSQQMALTARMPPILTHS